MSDLSLKQAAATLGVSVRTAWEMLQAGDFPGAWRRSKRGAWRIPSSDLATLRAKRTARLKRKKSAA